MWTPDARRSELRPYKAQVWRVVEMQSRVSTTRLTDSNEEQEILERSLERSKPALPPDCAGRHWLIATPFRYAPYPANSRFRRAGQAEGVFYAAEKIETAIAEAAFYLLLFFAESPATPLPDKPVERTAFTVDCKTPRAIDLGAKPFDAERRKWTRLSDYAPCLDLADIARKAGVELIRYESVRDPAGGRNVAVLSVNAIADREPKVTETWHLHVGKNVVRARREFPKKEMEFAVAGFGRDERLSMREWN